jgi:tRNA-2-methylthio-N6-dimethylallyladenosine synthase
MSRTYLLETYGCQMNKAESAALENILSERGWEAFSLLEDEVDPREAPSLVIINTCSVRATAETRVWGRLAHFTAMKKKHPLTLVVCGCMAERLGAELKKKQPGVDHVIGTQAKNAFSLLLDAVEKGVKLDRLDESPCFVFAPSHAEPGAFRSFVPIMHGCNNFCSYCIVPVVRGREISRSPESILAELQSLSARGVREITLLGQNVNSYKYGDLDFAGLLKLIKESLRPAAGPSSAIEWVRFLSSHPKDLSDESIQVLASDPLFCRHVHLCVQHGSDRVLQAMNRKYTVRRYLELVDKLRGAMPNLSLSTDILIGFPGETDADFQATLDLMRTVRFEYAYMYYYNPREGTEAAAMPDQLPLALKKERLAQVIALQSEITKERMRERVGSRARVLAESVSRNSASEILGRSEQDEMIVFEGSPDLIGSFVDVELRSLRGKTLKARRI